MIYRYITKTILSKLNAGKAILVLGPRQTGKTTLLKTIAKDSNFSYVWFNGDNPADSKLLENSSVEHLKNIIGNKRIIFIDEAQEIMNIGKTVKLITDYIEDVIPIISGSSAFELSNELNEPLTGRKFEYNLFPFSFTELKNHNDLKTEMFSLERRLIYGSYPEVVVNEGNEKEILNLLSSSYLYKDIFKFGDIRKPADLSKIVQLLAWQIGSEVNISEIANEAGVSSETVERYIDILEKAFIVFRLPAFARNVRNEIKKNKKVYFYDNGIRNAIIGNYNLLTNRNDIGGLWENYLVSERRKKNYYSGFYGHAYFWRTQQQQEIDYLEEVDGEISLFEFKWNPNKDVKFPKTFLNNYEIKSAEVINSQNYYNFL